MYCVYEGRKKKYIEDLVVYLENANGMRQYIRVDVRIRVFQESLGTTLVLR